MNIYLRIGICHLRSLYLVGNNYMPSLKGVLIFLINYFCGYKHCVPTARKFAPSIIMNLQTIQIYFLSGLSSW